MKKLLGSLMIMAVATNVTSCASNTQGENTGIGAAAGAVVGGVAGAAVTGGKAVGIGIGAVAGLFIGGAIGNSMESSDQVHVYRAVGNGQTVTWVNSDNHTTYRVVSSRHYVVVNGNHYCRKYVVTATTQGKSKQTKGVACRQTDGTWKNI